MPTLLYHDVVPEGDFAASGFGGNGASRYKFTAAEFERHMAAIARVQGELPIAAIDPRHHSAAGGEICLTFDDGGVSAHRATADILERRGWRGTFFITTDYLGKPGFLNAAEVRDLRGRGHTIGTHSCSHPPLMARRTHAELTREWAVSGAVLSDILGEKVVMASVPGGFYARNVAAAAAESGITAMFTSEPISVSSQVDGCMVFGRFTIQRSVSAATAARIAAGDRVPRFVQYFEWQVRKTLQRFGGIYYHRLRKSWFDGYSHEKI